jgi:hypothetical protein
MAAVRKDELKERRTRRPPATTPESRENQLVAQAYDLAERQIRDGTASSQIITHFLKHGSPREKMERERLEKENDLLRAKIEQLASAKNVEVLYKEALDAMRSYSGQPPEDVDDGYDDEYYD